MSSSSIPGVEDPSESAEIGFALGLLRQTRHGLEQIGEHDSEELEQRARQISDNEGDHYPILCGMQSADLESKQHQAERSEQKVERVIEILENLSERSA